MGNVVNGNIPSTMTNLDRSVGQFCLLSYRDHKTVKSGAEGPSRYPQLGEGSPGTPERSLVPRNSDLVGKL